LKKRYQKRYSKQEKEDAILLSLIDLYIKEGKPIGSNSLKESGLGFVSSATIRNYFAKLEKLGYLTQQHTSGGRIPTYRAYRKYVDNIVSKSSNHIEDFSFLPQDIKQDTKQISNFLHLALENLAKKTNLPTFLSSPRFDQDFIQNIKLLKIDKTKLLCAVITDFGVVKTETLYTDQDLSEKDIKTVENFFLWRIGKSQKPTIDDKLCAYARHLYNEIIIRHVVSAGNTSIEEIYKTGLSNLLTYKEFEDPSSFAKSLSLFEDEKKIQDLLNTCCLNNKISYFIGDELLSHKINSSDCCVIAIPYKINQITAGAIAVLGPMRLPYKKLLTLLNAYSEYISSVLTSCVYKFKISFSKKNKINTNNYLDYEKSILLEDKSQ
jgi:heat-inducible transcriptional repressor